MKLPAEHIISSLNWNTTFNEKEKAGYLQERLSSLSRFKLQREISRVFDDHCPEDQTWRIDSLELDLGTIDFNYLETELIPKLRKQLREKLNDLMFYGGNGNESIEILESGLSQIEALNVFLLNGIFPWNFREKEASVNSLIEELLMTHRPEVIAMIRKTGKTSVEVRRRMAWQIKEPLIIEVINELEPADSEKIIGFSDELIRIQNKETIVQASITDFRKNIWFWIFNYLLTERGTVFNKIAFVRYNIKQMANHYNIDYSDLLNLINRGVNIVAERYHVQSTFISTIKELIHEEAFDSQSAQNPVVIKEIGYSDLLMEFFMNSAASGHRKKSREFNALVIDYSQKDRIGFQNLIQKLNHSEIKWLNVIKDLEDRTLKIVFGGMNAVNSPVVLQGISFLNALNSDCELGLHRNVIWHSALKLMLANKNTVLNEQMVIDHLVKDLLTENESLNPSGRFRLSVSRPDITVPADIASSFSRTLATLFENIDESFYEKHLNELLNELADQLSGAALDKNRVAFLRKFLLKSIPYNPSLAFKIFHSSVGKINVKEILLTLYSTDEIFAFILRPDPHVGKIVSNILDVLDKTKMNLNLPADKLRSDIITSALAGALRSPQLKDENYVSHILSEVSDLHNSSVLFEQFVQALSKHSDRKGFDLPLNIKENGKDAVIHAEIFGISVIREIVKKRQSRTVLLKNLKLYYSDPTFVKYRNESMDKHCWILEYSIAQGNALKANLINKYAQLLGDIVKATSANAIRKILNELFWTCIIETKNFYGQAGFIENSFQARIKQHFSVSFIKENEKIRFKERSGQDINEKIGNEELSVLLKTCIENGKNEIEFHGKIISFKNLFSAALEIMPHQLWQIIRQSVAGPLTAKLIREAVHFDQFCLWITSETPLTISKAIRNIHSLSSLLLNDCSDRKQKELLALYWRHIFQILKTGSYSSAGLSKLVRKSFSIVVNEEVNLESLIAEIGKTDNEISSELLEAIAENLSDVNQKADVLINSVVIEDTKLDEVESKGLLYEFILYIITQEAIPDWANGLSENQIPNYLKELLSCHPVKLFQVLKHEFIPESRLNWFHAQVGFKKIISAITKLNRGHASALSVLEQFYSSLDHITLPSISSRELKTILFRKLIAAWTSNNWNIISTNEIWNELFRDVTFSFSISRKEFLASFEAGEVLLPPALRISLRSLKSEVEAARSASVPQLPKTKKHSEKIQTLPEVISEALLVKNAGLVLINNYISTLLDRTGITKERNFVSVQKQMDAIHYLQYVATGSCETEEALLPLNKILCGVPLLHPIPAGAEIPDEHKKIITGLIKAIMGHWPAIGDTSINGFRGNWLVRGGKLSEQKEKWELTVEKRAYDLLINKSPFSFSIIKYPWMDKPLHVTWAY